jgi:glycosyltransferase involved in cell wall biosynthesis
LSIAGVHVLRRAVWDHAIDALVVDKRRDLLHGALAVRGLPVALVSRFMYPGWAAPTDPLTRLAYRRVDLTAFLSDNAVPYAARHARFMLRPTHVAIHEGIDAGLFRPDPAAAATFRRWHGLGERQLIIGVGALEAEKRYDVLIDAVARLPQPWPDVVIIGEGSRRAALAAAAAARGVSLHLPGTVSHEMLAGAYAAATIFAHPSTMEAFGIAVAEAMACECPVVAADAGSLPEVVGNAGVIVPPDDAAALSGALRDLLREPARRRTLGETGRKRVLERFGLARMQAAHLAALRAAVAHRRSRD